MATILAFCLLGFFLGLLKTCLLLLHFRICLDYAQFRIIAAFCSDPASACLPTEVFTHACFLPHPFPLVFLRNLALSQRRRRLAIDAQRNGKEKPVLHARVLGGFEPPNLHNPDNLIRSWWTEFVLHETSMLFNLGLIASWTPGQQFGHGDQAGRISCVQSNPDDRLISFKIKLKIKDTQPRAESNRACVTSDPSGSCRAPRDLLVGLPTFMSGRAVMNIPLSPCQSFGQGCNSRTQTLLSYPLAGDPSIPRGGSGEFE
ncbi:hypothetical protein B0H13DRAFT_1936186 [Mycena leptocephala]|nr:hypothetical protein B0H13DRAFT_1936186 [Mycena leptocephala]